MFSRSRLRGIKKAGLIANPIAEMQDITDMCSRFPEDTRKVFFVPVLATTQPCALFNSNPVSSAENTLLGVSGLPSDISAHLEYASSKILKNLVIFSSLSASTRYRSRDCNLRREICGFRSVNRCHHPFVIFRSFSAYLTMFRTCIASYP